MEPGLIGIAGDWHRNEKWAVSAIRDICERLPGESPRIILQAGDLGVWVPPGEERWEFAGKTHWRRSFLSLLDDELHEQDAYLWFVDGNHENHPLLAGLWGKLSESDPSYLTSRIRYLCRGERWEWHGKKWLACGGAVSVDKLSRTEGISWFPQETISQKEEILISMTGPADVLLSHDAPADCPLVLGVPPENWMPMIPAAEDHRDRLQRICVAVKPSHVFHGHYHLWQDKTIHAIWGKCRFVSLDMDGRHGNWGILDTRTMEWEW